MNVYEEDTYPFLAQETIAIQKALERGSPVIGFCLGAQLMAKAVCLASSQDYPNQAMRVGTKDMIAGWLRTGDNLPDKILKDSDINLPQAHVLGTSFFSNYLEMIGTS